MADMLKKLINFYAHEYFLDKNSAQIFVDEQSNRKYVIMSDEEHKERCLISLGLSLIEDKAQAEIRFYIDESTYSNEEQMKICRDLMHDFLVDDYDVDDLNDNLFLKEDRRLLEPFGKVGYALTLSNCCEPYFLNVGEEDEHAFFGIKAIFLTEEEFNKVQELKKESNSEEWDFVFDLEDEKNGTNINR